MEEVNTIDEEDLDPTELPSGQPNLLCSEKLQGHGVIVWVDGQQRELAIFGNQALIKKLLIKSLQNQLMNFSEYLELMRKEAISAWRRTLRRIPTDRQVTM